MKELSYLILAVCIYLNEDHHLYKSGNVCQTKNHRKRHRRAPRLIGFKRHSIPIKTFHRIQHRGGC